MTAPFGLAVVSYSLLVGVVYGVAAGRGAARGRLMLPTLCMVEALLAAQAVVDVVRLATGARPAEPATHVGYLMTSLAILPMALAAVRGDDGRWANAAVAIGCLVAAVVSIRLHQTLSAGHV